MPFEYSRMPLNTARPMLGTPSAVVELCGIYRGSTILGQLGKCHTGEYVVTWGTNDVAEVFATREDVQRALHAVRYVPSKILRGVLTIAR